MTVQELYDTIMSQSVKLKNNKEWEDNVLLESLVVLPMTFYCGHGHFLSDNWQQ